jgi:hypothetical protein
MTLGELKARMTHAELQTWAAYVECNGPLSIALRTDAAVARAVLPFLKNAKMADFMPWPKEPEQEATPDAVFNMLRGLKKH